MRIHQTVIVALLAIFAYADPARAVTILSLNFVNNNPNGQTAYTGGGVLDPASRTWSTMTGSTSNANGGGSVSATFGSVGVNIPDYGDFQANTSATLNLFDGYVFSGISNAGVETISLTGLNNALTYDLAVYAAWFWNTQANTFSVTGLAGTTANQSTTGADTSSFVSGNNYVVFSGLQPVGGSLTINLDGGNGAAQWFVSGLELVQVPEPNSLVLALIGGLLIWVTKRRRNR